MAAEGYSPWQGVVPQLKRSIFLSFTLRGRSRRSELIYYYLASGLLAQIAFNIFFPVQITADGEFSRHWGHWVVDALIFIPTPALLVRRSHDQDRTGWWALFVIIVASGLGLVGSLMGQGADIPIWLGFGGVLVSLSLLVFLLQPGSVGANRFGPDPRLESPT